MNRYVLRLLISVALVKNVEVKLKEIEVRQPMVAHIHDMCMADCLELKD